MEFPYGENVVRERRPMLPDPYNPTRLVRGTWDDQLDSLTLEDVFVGSSSSSGTGDATRTQALTSKSLFCTNGAVDVKVGDRVRRGGDVYYIHARPTADVNPFTGWAAPVEIPLEMTEG